jgi:serine/threonine protein kinase/tetratricopeptide (TPR) repeat protein
MAVDAARAKSIFLAASELPNLAERADYLVQQCGSDGPLRARVDALLRAHDAAADLGDDSSGLAFEATIDAPAVIQPGTLIAGRYKLLEAIGEGGMGSVWLAEQKEPVKRKVAVKLIKPGMDSRSVLARFEAERQALALMDHPNIAKVFDGGMTAEGRPFFVMEFVKGIPLTEYCDQARLSLKERLNLFTPVCQAVQHAHQKGIIHRDLKPSNILICLYDGKPVPKVIDFGLAKAMHQSLTEQSLHTAFGMMVGTPLYMSPEQAEHNNLDVDTRTDIYSLGVILYELLTGSTPLERHQLKQAAFNEILRLIKEVEPPKPSTRLSGSASLPSVAAQRSIDPKQLSKMLAGDLDWIVMKALDKERSRRYETANGLARDIDRYLNDEAVEACPPTTAYRLKKFIHRNRLQVIAASLVLLALVAGIVGTSVGLYQANHAREAENRQRKLAEANEREANEQRAKAEGAAEQEKRAKEDAVRNLRFAKKGNELLGSVFTGLDPNAKYDTVGELREALLKNLKKAVAELDGSAIGDPLEVAAMQNTLGQSLIGLGEWKLAVEVFEKARNTRKAKLGPDHPATLNSMRGLASGYRGDGQLNKALPLMEETLKRMKANLGPNHPDTLVSMNGLAGCYVAAGQFDKAVSLYEETLKLMKAEPDTEQRNILTTMSNLTESYRAAGQLGKAVPLGEETLKLMKAKLGPNDPGTLNTMQTLAACYRDAGQHDKAVPLFEETLKLTKAKLGPDHPGTIACMSNLAESYWSLKQLDKSVPLFEELLPLCEKKLGRDHKDTQQVVANLGVNYKDAGRLKEAIPLLEQAYQASKKFPDLRWVGNSLSDAYAKAGQYDKAVPLLEEMLTLTKAEHGPDHPDTLTSMHNLAVGYRTARMLDMALPLFEETLRLRKAKLPPEHPDTLDTMNSLAVGYINAGQPEKALPLLEETIRLQKTKLGPDHLNTLTSMINLATSYWSLKQLDKSVPLFEELLPQLEKKLGRTHPEMQMNVANLGVNYRDAGRVAEAIPLLEEAYQASKEFPALRRWVGPELLDAYAKVGKPAEAMKLLDEVVADLRKLLPKASPQLAGKLAHLGMSLLEIKAYTEAEPLLRECLAIREKTQPDAWTTFNTQSMLGRALLGQKKYADAEPLLLKGYEGMKARENTIPLEGKIRVPEAIARLVLLYTDWHTAEPDKGYDAKAAEWQQKLDEHNAASATEESASTSGK